MPRPRPLPSDDALLSAAEAAALVKVSRSRWDGYSRRFSALVRGRRVVQANPEGPGVTRWLRSAVIEHMHRELVRDRKPRRATPRRAPSPTCDADPGADSSRTPSEAATSPP